MEEGYGIQLSVNSVKAFKLKLRLHFFSLKEEKI